MKVRGLHIWDAYSHLNSGKTKGHKLASLVTRQAAFNGVTQKNMQELNLWVKEAYVGKALNFKKLDIRARGKMGMIRVPKSKITVILEEKPFKELFKLMLMGQTPPAVAEAFRLQLFQKDADLPELQKMAHVTTAQGRFYRKEQFERLVQMVEQEYQSRGLFPRKKQIIRNLLEKEASKFIEKMEEKESASVVSTKSERQKMYEEAY